MRKLFDNMKRENAGVFRITKELDGMGYVIHHTEWAAGYLPRNEWSITSCPHEFSGVVVDVPSFASSRSHIRIYFIKKS